MNIFKRLTGTVLAAAIGLSLVPHDIPENTTYAADAASFTYPVQEFRIAINDTNRNLNVFSADEGAYLNSLTLNGTRNEKWYLNYVSSGVYEIVSSQTGYIVTNENGLAVMEKDTDGANQRWKIEAVEQDFDGFDLYYKIVSNSDSSVGLTFNANSNSVSVDEYTGDEFQKFRIDLDGLEGFGAASLVNGKMKAGTIGGLLGETVFVSNLSDLISALDSTEPKTVVVTADIDMVNQDKDKQRIRDNKTLVGAYSGVTIYDSLLRNDDFWGEDERPSNNIVIRNLNFTARYLNSSGSGNILLQFYGVRNLWVDHNSFSATFDQNRDSEVGKFLWINTPSESWSDGKYNSYNPDYITISYNYLKNRYWTFAFGSQNKDTSRLHTSVMFNKWEQCSRRCPQYSNGFDHNYNNYHTVTGSSNPNKSSQVIGGEGSRVVNENCRFEGYVGNELDPDRNSAISFTESGSYTADSPSGSVSAIKFTNLNTSEWTPSACYGYSLVSAYNTNGTDIKSFCNTYSGSQKSYDSLKCITDSDLSNWVTKKYDCPFRSIEVGNDPVGNLKTGIELNTNAVYTFTNIGSGLYFSGSTQEAEETRFTIEAADGGYYRIYTTDKKQCLSVEDGKTDNAAAIVLSSPTGSDAELFKFVLNEDGTYTITTGLTSDVSCFGVAAGSKEAGALVVQWECDGSDSQKWTIAQEGELFRHLVITDTEHISSWYICGDTAVDSLLYGDRTFTYSELPDAVSGAEAIITACDSKYTNSDLAYFTAAKDMTVYVAMDVRVTADNAWLADWTKTDLTCKSSNDVTFVLWQREISEGEKVILGTNGQSSSCVNYTVFAVESAEKVIKGNVNADDEFSVADLVMMQSFLLGRGTLTDWTAGDLCEDGAIDAFDMVMMKKLLLEQTR